MSDETTAPDGVCAADGGPGTARRRVLNAGTALCLLLIVASWVLPEHRWAPWWPPPVTLIAGVMATGLPLSAPDSRRRTLAVGLFCVAAAVGWGGRFASWADVLDGVAQIGLALGVVTAWPLLGLPTLREVRHWRESARP